jgi:hypothetical protein
LEKIFVKFLNKKLAEIDLNLTIEFYNSLTKSFGIKIILLITKNDLISSFDINIDLKGNNIFLFVKKRGNS